MTDYALILISAFVAAAISGAAGFGGALLLLPLLTHTVGVADAVPLLTISQLVGNLSRVGFGRASIHWPSVGTFLLGALPATLIGATSFVVLPQSLVVRLIGATIFAFVIINSFGLLTFKPSKSVLLIGGACVGLLSGLVGSAGPLGAAIFLTLNLPPASYIASEATSAVGMHVVKIFVYGTALHLGTAFWALAFAMSFAMVLGTWASKRVVDLVPPELFGQFVRLLLIIVATGMMLGWVS